MIRAMLFDLDGTLVQTERLKALSYARAMAELVPDPPSETAVLDAYRAVVGLPRREVAETLLRRFGLVEAARARTGEFGVGSPWQAFVQLRLAVYNRLLNDPVRLRSSTWPHTVGLLHRARRMCGKVGLATMSDCAQTNRVLEILDLRGTFDFVATIDDVERGKPDPEIYLLLARELAVEPAECLVIEDSVTGIQAALAAGMACVAVPTPFTRDAIAASGLLDPRWIADDPAALPEVVERRAAEVEPRR
ncbi:MAG: HAD family phosphatase [Candidatus Dadabacteria bacterium]|nr:MAG: HAD family phosphatase [Candidatus Dadabacteria bacterium]